MKASSKSKPSQSRTAASDPASAAFDPIAFKSVMRKLAGTVTVISAGGEDGLHGMTATAMCSVSADPPTILIVVNRSARTHLHIDKTKTFTVNVLAEGQLAVAQLFASKAEAPFARVDHRLVDGAAPVIADAAAYVHCAVLHQFDVETHTIFVGRVLHADATAALPLVYQDAGYARVQGV